mmetsp:Transcript_41597/g.99721  ORF Transcript_41597/g.99721 Transcript_41597/m.99721 type:complete len:532 (+) Transcript_41597:141-1736(+)
MGWEEEMHDAKLRHRPRLKGNWERDGMAKAFPKYLESLQRQLQQQQQQQYYQQNNHHGPTAAAGHAVTGAGSGAATTNPVAAMQLKRQLLQQQQQSFFVDDETSQEWHDKGLPALPVRLDAARLTKDEFCKYEVDCVPCVITNIPNGYDGGQFVGKWPGADKWQLSALAEDETLVDRRFKCGEDDDERTIRVKLRDFLEYLKHNRDDSPLYIFDSRFDDDRLANQILNDYRVPSYFSDDLFGLVSESRRPPYRWWLIGPKRSGTCVHIDPLATSAWNTLIEGKKRWVLFPPHLSKSVVKGSGLVHKNEDDEAVHYFSFILPRIKRKATLMKGMPKYKGFSCFEFTQHAGETVYVPHGWWHAVLNLTDTVAVTQNFCSPRNFDAVWLKTRSGRKRMAWKWLCALEKDYPELAARARAMNAADSFVMKYDPVEIERRERAELEAKRRKKERKEAEAAQQSSSQNDNGSDDRSRPRSKSPDEDRERMNCDDEDASNNSSSHKTPEDNDDDDDGDAMKVCRQDSDSPRSTVYSEI